MSDVPDSQVIDAMSRCGGRFIRSLAVAARHADSRNLAKIKATWREEWKQYGAMTEMILGQPFNATPKDSRYSVPKDDALGATAQEEDT